MPPFLQFRLWWDRASVGRRSATGVASAVVLALLVWTAVPSSGHESLTSGFFGGAGSVATTPGGQLSPGTTRGGPTAAAAAATAAGGGGSEGAGGGPAPVGAATGSATGPATAGASSGSTSGGSSATPSATGGTQTGATACPGSRPTLKIGVSLPSEQGGTLNTTFGIPSPSEEQADYNAVFDSINKSGGVACHNLVGDFTQVDGFNPASAQSDCLQWAQDKVFAALGGFLPAATDDCPLQHGIPFFEEVPLSAADAQHYYPYYLSVAGNLEVIYKNFVMAAKQLGVFDPAKGFKKLGIFYRDCQPDVNAALLADLAAIGVTGGQISKYDFGCPANFADPSAVEQAVLQFKAAGVTTATIDNSETDAQRISQVSQAQGFHPRWALPDNGIVAITESAEFQPDPTNWDGAIAVTPQQYGAEHSGVPETSVDQQCDQIMTSHGLPPIFKSGDDFAGAVCDLVWMLAAGIEHAPALSPDQLVAGLHAVGSVPFAFPDGPNNFSAPGTTTGGQFWRTVEFHASCGCWKLLDPTFHPSF